MCKTFLRNRLVYSLIGGVQSKQRCSLSGATGKTHEQGHRGDDAIRGEPEEDV